MIREPTSVLSNRFIRELPAVEFWIFFKRDKIFAYFIAYKECLGNKRWSKDLGTSPTLTALRIPTALPPKISGQKFRNFV